MGSRVRRYFLLPATAALGLFAGCDQHELGELPEVQKEHIYPTAMNEKDPGPSDGQTPAAKPTPADFFPDSGR